MLGFTIVYYVVLARQGYGLSFGVTVNRILDALVWKGRLGRRLGQKANTYSQRQKALCRCARHLIVGPDADKLHWWFHVRPKASLVSLQHLQLSPSNLMPRTLADLLCT